ncbi:putative protease [Paenibacillus sp. SORGH_AS306]|uniref:peptidase U32 family protein n=1 Tax=unclassified Paenibacillus TaxID=185978 RepID=UPI002782E2AE|nr:MULTISPECIES: peptidase U32 family protein [unclassified Paenibacillus]MDQ1235310.1 putative protease [Paenibacillus sp. SORGH_AS_0306]MDR6112359.1 putative protease [Paenibacillus sp. SORGH_AS_0338]
MNKKPELLVTASSLEELYRLAEAGADAFLIGEERYGMRLSGEFNVEDIAQAVDYAHEHGKRIYVAVNNLMTNDLLEGLPDYMKQMAKLQVDGIEFGDPAIVGLAREYAPEIALHWNAEMTSTNATTANYWGRKGATRAVLARELNMDEITGMIDTLEVEAQVQVHGMTNIYHSKRRLVGSYMQHQGRPVDGDDLGLQRGLFLIEAERRDEKFPIYEDNNGTHIMSSEDVCILEDLHLLMEAGVQSFKIEGILKSIAYNETAVRMFRQAIDQYVQDPEQYEFDESWMDEIRRMQDPERELSFGFFYKEQVF